MSETPEKEQNNHQNEESDASEFSLESLKSHFEKCIGENGEVYVDKYLLGELFSKIYEKYFISNQEF